MAINNKHCIGITTLGEKGQVVIPAEIRKSLNLKSGEKLIVFSKDDGIIGLSKISNFEKFTSHLAKIQNLIKKQKTK
ncbi:MAG: AbrB/MazE/SpoVT family DNA-binding domain-containing protein [bacterium]|nr:AbrB/MazE/SpoVT family DNA-binding domain-containing protein [bacterium]